jgi:predicted esterase
VDSDTTRNYSGPYLEDWYRTPDIFSWNTEKYRSYIFDDLALRLLYPPHFSEDSAKSDLYPLLIYLHGYGERGPTRDNESQLKTEGKYFLDLVEKRIFNGFILMPQNSDGYWTPADLLRIHELIDYMVRFKKVDPFRISFKGYSAGAGGVWRFMRDYPLQIALGICISHPGGDGEYNPSYIREIPVWLCQGLKDQQSPPAQAHWFLQHLKELGVPIEYSEFPQGGHNLDLESENDPIFLKLLNKSNKLNPKLIYSSGLNKTGSSSFPGLYISEGYPEYQWSKNGIILEKEKSYFLRTNTSGEYRVRVKVDGDWSYWSPSPVKINSRGKLEP